MASILRSHLSIFLKEGHSLKNEGQTFSPKIFIFNYFVKCHTDFSIKVYLVSSETGDFFMTMSSILQITGHRGPKKKNSASTNYNKMPCELEIVECLYFHFLLGTYKSKELQAKTKRAQRATKEKNFEHLFSS